MALVESQGLENEIVPRVASALGGGMGGSHQLVCGALSGGVLAAGALWGRDKPGEEGPEQAYNLADALIQGFRQEFGTVLCCELIGDEVGVEPGDERWSEMFHAKDVRQTCARFVRFVAARWFELFEEMTKER